MEVKALALYNGQPNLLKTGDSISSPIEKILSGSSNRYYSSPSNGAAISTAAIVANTLYAMPFIAEKEFAIDSIAMKVTTLGASSNLRFGIYSSQNLYPNSLIVDSGSIPGTTIGVKSAVINITLTQALYWLVCVCSATAPVVSGFTAAGLNPILGLDNTLSGLGLGYGVAFTFAALPATFPAGASIRTAVPLPLIALHGK